MARTDSYRFSFGPWNIHSGADPFGPPVRKEREFADKLKEYKKLGFDECNFMMMTSSLPTGMRHRQKGCERIKKMLDGEAGGRFVAAHLGGSARLTAITSNNARTGSTVSTAPNVVSILPK